MSRPSTADVQAAFCATLVDEWVRAGVAHAVVSPGSRSTPMVLALDRDGRIQVELVLDERSAGFVALGMGLATGRPAVVVTTSGTASVELHPAVVEAYQAGVPLLAVTTDRPPELHRVGAPQTVEQDNLFSGTVVWSASPGVADPDSAGSWRSLASRAALEARSGPVHLNLAFREPLIGDGAVGVGPPGRSAGAPWHLPGHRPAAGADPAVADLLRSYAGRRGLIVAGAMSQLDGEEVLGAADRLGWPVLADPRSGLRTPHRSVVASADALFRIDTAAAQEPDLVVRIGAPWASKALSQWLGGLGPDVPQVLVPDGKLWADPERSASIITTVASLVEAASGTAPVESAWYSMWRRAEVAAQEVMDELTDLSEPGLARTVVRSAPDGAVIFVSSSMPIRDVEWFGPARRDLRVLSNRGANGIDGIISTAIGVAVAGGSPTVALTGDLAFLYDASSLLWASERDMALTVVVVDNDGGGIFSFLSQAKQLPPEQFEARWGTPHGTDPALVAQAYGIKTVSISTLAEVEELLAQAAEPGMRVAVVKSDRDLNVAVHERWNRSVADATAHLFSLRV